MESLYDFLEGIIGPDLVKKTFWFFATIFIFILSTNWFGLIPGRRHDRLGRAGRRMAFRGDTAAAPRRQRRSEHDLRHGDGVLRVLDCLGAAGNGVGRRSSRNCSAPRANDRAS